VGICVLYFRFSGHPNTQFNIIKEETMKKTFVVILVGVAVLSVFCPPLFGADFAPIFPKQVAPMVSPPNFTWAAGDYDLFCLYL
jgi:hypothetical protein